ncbi:sugar phosphate isomerase/epimerase family protein, partial [Streptomyces sp. NPDC000851]
MLKTAAQEQLLPGKSLQEKWEFAQNAGYDAIELR